MTMINRVQCSTHSDIDNTQCLQVAEHVGPCTFNDQLGQEDSPIVFTREELLSEFNLSQAKNTIARAASPDAPRDPDKPQSDLQHRFDLIDAPALFEMTGVLYTGAKKYGDDSWRRIPVEDHLNHLLAHVYAYLSGDRSDDHLSNIQCRAMFAQGKALRPEFRGRFEEKE